jgi:dihydroorotate dehydrogenase (NAD+) catalytic subunit
VIGRIIEDFGDVVARLDGSTGLHAYELNVSCPNTRAGGLEFGADAASLTAVITRARAATRRPIFVKLSPTLPDIGFTARVAVDAGADGISVVNTMPGLVIDLGTRKPTLGFGSGGVSGPGLRPVGVLATWKVRKAVTVPIIGLGGVGTAEHALQYILAGASLVAVGTAALADPRVPETIARDLAAWCARNGVPRLADLQGTLDWK